jgi:hypothetical protein
VFAPPAVKVTEFPAQIFVEPEAVIETTVVLANVVSAVLADAVHPFAAVPTTLYVPAVPVVIEPVVAALDQT